MAEAKVISSDVVALAQHVELNGSGWFDEAVKKAIRFLLWINDEPTSLDTIYDEREAVGLNSVTKKELQVSIDAMIEGGMILPTNDGRVKLTEQEASALRHAIETAQSVEQKVRSKVLDAATAAGAKFKEDSAVKMWDSFHREFIAPFVSEFGARAYELVTGVTPEAKKTQFITEFLGRFGEDEKGVLEPMILALLDKNSSDCRTYVLRMMNSYFFHSATKLPNETIEKAFSLDKRSRSLRFVLDTNFLFSLFGLHENPANEAVGLLIATIGKLPKAFNIGMYVLPTTVNEFRRALATYESQARNISSTSSVVSAGLQYGVAGVLKTYLKNVQESGYTLNAKDYFGPFFENINALLDSKSVKILHGADDIYATDQSTIDDTTDQYSFYKQKFINEPRKQKSWEQVYHDMVLIHYVLDKRPSICDTVFDADWVGVTIDRGLLAFDNRKRHAKGVPYMVDPAALVQVLQFIIPSDENLEKTILALMQMPFLVEPFNVEDERVTQRILSTISRFENVGDLDKETVLNILGSQALRNKIERVHDRDEEIALIKDALVEYAATLKREADEAAAQLAAAERKHKEEGILKEKILAVVNREKQEAERLLDISEKEVEQREKNEADLQIRIHQLEDRETQRLAEDVRKSSARIVRREISIFILTLGILLIVIGVIVFATLVFPEIIPSNVWWLRYFVYASVVALVMLPFHWILGRLTKIADRRLIRFSRWLAYGLWSIYLALVVTVVTDWVSGSVQKDLPDPKVLIVPMDNTISPNL